MSGLDFGGIQTQKDKREKTLVITMIWAMNSIPFGWIRV
jgi:hypothetical protein